MKRLILLSLSLLFLIALLAAALPLHAQTIFVDADAPAGGDGLSWTTAYTNLQDALTDAESGGVDQIWVAEGVYTPVTPVDPDNVTEDEREATFQLINGVAIYGGFDPDDGDEEFDDRDIEANPTILSGDIDRNDNPFDPEDDSDGDPDTPAQTDHIVGDNSLHVVTGTGTDGTAVLDGLTVTAGLAKRGAFPDNTGGGMFNGGSPTLKGVTFTGNTAQTSGGGMYNIDTNRKPTLTDVSFTSNSAGTGGGIYNVRSSPMLTGVTFIGNRAFSGGGMANSNSNPTLTNVTFAGNNSAGFGGGGGVLNTSDLSGNSSSPTLTNVVFSGNSADFNGGGMVNEIDSSPTLTNVTFSGNSAGITGGGMYNIAGSSPTLTNVTFSGNSAVNVGGGMRNEDSNPTLINVIIWDNQAIGSTTSPSASISNNDVGSTPEISHSLIANSFDEDGNWGEAIGIDGGSNIDIDPQFVEPVNPGDAPTIAGNLRLQSASPAINAGTNAPFEPGGVAEGITTDLAGNERIFDSGTIDMGAYEFQGEPETPITLTMDEGWRMLSSPIAGQSYDDMLGPLWTQGVDGADYTGGDPNVYTWNIGYSGDCIAEYELGEECEGWITPDPDLDATIPPGSGFIIFVFEDDEFGQDPPGEFDKTLTVSGVRHSGNIEPAMNENPEGWTLVGNPYGLPVAFGALDKTDLTDVAYVYDPNLTEDEVDDGDLGPTNGNRGGWRTTDGNFGDIPTGNIAPGQGFFVQNDGAAGSLTFGEYSKVGDGQFYGKEKERRDFVRLEVQGESLYNSAWIRFSEEGSLERTEGEALELQPLDSHYAIMGARKTDGTLMDIAHYPLDTQELEIPLAVDATQSGQFTITATDLDLPAGMQLYLHDTQTGESMPIGDDSFEYSFSLSSEASAQADLTVDEPQKKTLTTKEILAVGAIGPSKAKTSGTDRFLITTSPSADGPQSELPDEVALGQNYPNPFNPTTMISYQLPQQSQVRLEVYDMVGRRVATLVDEQVAAGTHQVSFDAGNLSSGVYLYRLTASGLNGRNQIFTKKLTLIK